MCLKKRKKPRFGLLRIHKLSELQYNILSNVLWSVSMKIIAIYSDLGKSHENKMQLHQQRIVMLNSIVLEEIAARWRPVSDSASHGEQCQLWHFNTHLTIDKWYFTDKLVVFYNHIFIKAKHFWRDLLIWMYSFCLVSCQWLGKMQRFQSSPAISKSQVFWDCMVLRSSLNSKVRVYLIYNLFLPYQNQMHTDILVIRS